MARVKVKLPRHDCQTPNMIERVEAVEAVVGRWPFKRVETTHKTIYKATEAVWECPDCGNEWRFGYMVTGVWTVVRFGKEKWEWIDV